MSSSKKIYSMHPNVVAGEHGQHHARIADSYRLSILLTHMSYRACVLCRVRRRRTRRVRRRGPAPRDDARIGAVWPPGYGVRLVSDTAAVLRTARLLPPVPCRGLLGVAPFALITKKDHDLCTCRMLSSLSWTHTPTHCPLTCSTAKSRMRARARAHTSLIPHTGLHCCKAHDCTVQ